MAVLFFVRGEVDKCFTFGVDILNMR